MSKNDFILRGPVQEVPHPGQSLGEIFYNSLKTCAPSKPILIDVISEKSFLPKDVLRISKKFAFHLSKLGVNRTDVVGIVSENSTDYVFTMLACFFLGAPMNLLNPDYTTRELMHTFEISKPKFVITSEAKHDEIVNFTKSLDIIHKIVTFKDLHSDIPENDLESVHIVTGQDIDTNEQLAIILCSSGTTGLPKAVAITHENCKYANLYMKSPDIGKIDADARLLVLLPFYHIMGFTILTSVLEAGGTAVVLSKFKPDIYLQTIQDQKISLLFMVPPLALFLVKSPLTKDYDLSSVKDMVCGAAPLGAEVQTALEQKMGVMIRQAYGLTETCAVTITPFNDQRFPGNSGCPLINTQLIVRDIESNKILGPNQKGEICLKSPTIMKRYLNNEEATAAIFDEDGFLKSGDIGYYNNEGFVFIVDRLKELIKYKGFQVPPAELEDVLMGHIDILDAGVIGVKDERAGELAKAFVVKKPNSSLTETEILEYVAKHVSFQKQLHGGVQFLDAIPKNAAGKILRRELHKL